MRFILSALLVILLSFASHGQSGPVLTPSFSAVIVANMDTSSPWYQKVLSLGVKEKMTDPAGSYNVVILESATMTLELLELKGSLSRKPILQDKGDVNIQGHFKVGFKTTDMDALLKHLKSLQVEVPRVYSDAKTKKRNFLITDPDGNLIQFFE